MGIKNLNKFLRGKNDEIFEEINLSEYAYKKIAIDISLYLFKYKSVCGINWLSGFINLICCLRRNEIHCVFIYDGKAPHEKSNEKNKRKQDREKLRNQIIELEEALDTFYKTGEINEILINLYETRKIRSPPRLMGTKKEKISISWLEKKIAQKKTQLVNIQGDDINYTQELFDILKVPYYTAPQEAEKMCSKLCRDGLVDAVLSDDTDVIAYGTPSFLTKINTKNDTCVRLSNTNILEMGEFDNSEQLLDFCILSGTDYNTNIPRIGPSKSYELLMKHGNIENIKKNTNLNTDILNYENVRKLFLEFFDYGIEKIPYCGIPDFTKLYEFVDKHKLNNINVSKIILNFIRPVEIDLE